MTKVKIAVLEIQLKERDGIFYASSKDLPGLHLCGKSKKAVREDLPAMIKVLYRLNHGFEVDVEPPFDSEFKHKASNSLAMPDWFRLLATPTLDMHPA